MKKTLLLIIILGIFATLHPSIANTYAAKPATKKTTLKKPSKTPPQQSASSMQSRKATVQKEIKKSEKQISENDRNIRQSLNKIQSIEIDIKSTQSRLNKIDENINNLTLQINNLNQEIADRENRVKHLQKNYLEAIKKMRLKKGDKSTLAFIFSSKSMHQALRRIRYLREFAAWRLNTTQELNHEVATLKQKQDSLLDTKKLKETSLLQERNTQNLLTGQQQQQQKLVTQLRNDNKNLRSTIAKKQLEIKELNNKIAAAIEADRQRQKQTKTKPNPTPPTQTTKKDPPKNTTPTYAAARKRKPRAPSSSTETNTSNTIASTPTPPETSGFGAMRGALPRPVAGAYKVVSPYGRHSKPGLDNIVYDNTGIDIETSKGAPAKAVYDGTVSGIYKADGFSHVVLIKHQNYYTVYANLASVGVQQGQKIKQGQSLGNINDDGNGHSILHFEVWKERTRLNPSQWIR